MLTSELYDSLVDQSRGDWSHVKPVLMGTRVRKTSDRPPSTWRTGLRNWLLTYQGGLCPVCGDSVATAHFNHVIARGPNVKGFTPGNVFAGCSACNRRCADEYGTVVDGIMVDGGNVPLSALARPDLIATEWPDTATLAACR